MSFAGQVSITIAVRALVIAAGLVSSVVTARYLGPEGRGIFFYWTTLATLVIQFGNFGLHSSNTHQFAKGLASLPVLLANSVFVSLLVAGVSTGVGVAWVLLSHQATSAIWTYLLPTLVLIPAGLYFLLGTNLLVAGGRIGEYNVFELLHRILSVAALAVVVYYAGTVESALFVTSVVSLLICFVLHCRLVAHAGSTRPSFSAFRDGLGYALRAYVVAALGFCVLRVNVFLLRGSVTPEEFGVWSVATQLFEVLVVVPGSMALILFPRIMNSTQPFELMRTQVRAVFILMMSMSLCVVLFGQQLIEALYGAAYFASYDLLVYGLPGAVAVGVVTVISQYLAAEGMPLKVVWIWLLALAGHVVVSPIAITEFGVAGATIALSVTYVLLWAMMWRLAVKVSRERNIKNICAE